KRVSTTSSPASGPPEIPPAPAAPPRWTPSPPTCSPWCDPPGFERKIPFGTVRRASDRRDRYVRDRYGRPVRDGGRRPVPHVPEAARGRPGALAGRGRDVPRHPVRRRVRLPPQP